MSSIFLKICSGETEKNGSSNQNHFILVSSSDSFVFSNFLARRLTTRYFSTIISNFYLHIYSSRNFIEFPFPLSFGFKPKLVLLDRDWWSSLKSLKFERNYMMISFKRIDRILMKGWFQSLSVIESINFKLFHLEKGTSMPYKFENLFKIINLNSSSSFSL